MWSVNEQCGSRAGNRKGLVVVGQSYGGFTAPLVADRLPVDVLVLVAAMIPAPGEAPKDYWRNTGHGDAVRKQAARDGGVTGHEDPYVLFYHDVPSALAVRAMSLARRQSSMPDAAPWPLQAWPNVPTRVILCTEDRLFPAEYMRRVAAKRLGIVPARAAPEGSALGVDISAQSIDKARRLAAAEGLHNVVFEVADAEVHPFPPRHFDVVISRFGTMFFTDPVAGFTNMARASRPGARLVMMVWQEADRDEWATAITQSLASGRAVPVCAPGQDPFSLADPSVVEAILERAGYTDVGFVDVDEPVQYGRDVEAAYGLVRSMKFVADAIAVLNAPAARNALRRLRATLAAHVTSEGVLFGSRAWIVTARRRD